MINLGEHSPPDYNFDDSHRVVLDEIIGENSLDAFTAEDRYEIWWRAAHILEAWPDFPAVLPKLREKYICASLTILSFRIIIDTAKRNNLTWDAVFSCEAVGKYKVLPAPYLSLKRRQVAAAETGRVLHGRLPQLRPGRSKECRI